MSTPVRERGLPAQVPALDRDTSTHSPGERRLTVIAELRTVAWSAVNAVSGWAMERIASVQM
jgi:hypothetical protein